MPNTNATLVTRMQHKCNTSRTLHERHKCNTSATRTTRVQHEWKILILITTPVKTNFQTLIISYIASEKIRGEEQFHTKNYLLEMSPFYAKMRSKSAPKKLNFLMAKAISKSCTLDCSCKLNTVRQPHFR